MKKENKKLSNKQKKLLRKFKGFDYYRSERLFKKGTDPNFHFSNEGLTLLIYAVQKRDNERFEYLLKHNIDINLPDKDGVSVLQEILALNNRCIIIIIKYTDNYKPFFGKRLTSQLQLEQVSYLSVSIAQRQSQLYFGGHCVLTA